MSGDWQHGLFGCFDDITVCKLSTVIFRSNVLVYSCFRSAILLRSMLHLWKDCRDARRELYHARNRYLCPIVGIVLRCKYSRTDQGAKGHRGEQLSCILTCFISYCIAQGSFINDCLMVICCGICVLPQMYNVSFYC